MRMFDAQMSHKTSARFHFSGISMFHSSITERYEAQKNIFSRLIRLQFAVAGMYWIFIYLFNWMNRLQASDLAAFRSGQSMIYFILLTLWGIEYLREVKRYKAVSAEANARNCSPKEVNADSISAKWKSFSVLFPFQRNAFFELMPLLNVAFLSVAATHIVRQYINLIHAVMN